MLGIYAVLVLDVSVQPALVLAAVHLRRAVASGYLGQAADAHHTAPQLPDPRAPSLPARVDRPRDPPVLHPERHAGSAVLATPARAGVPACEERDRRGALRYREQRLRPKLRVDQPFAAAHRHSLPDRKSTRLNSSN